MMAERQCAKLAAATAIPLLLIAVWGVSRFNEPLAAALQPGPDVLSVSSARVIKALSLGYDSLMADIYWTRSVQYYGDKRHAVEQNAGSQQVEHYPLLDPLLEIAVTLDPQLVVAYKFGAVFLTEPSPHGAGRPDLAARLLRKAIANNPDAWRLWADLGMIYYENHDYRSAAQAYLEGSRHPKAGEWMKVMAAKIAQEGSTPQISFFLWTQIYNSTADPMIRKNALEHLQQLQKEFGAKR
jgi:tetratricopeptide (TPR) repeat protein